MSKQPIDQNKVLGANYIADFFLEIKALTEQYANYKNIHLELEYLSNQAESKIDPDQLNNAKTAINNIRFISNKVYIHFRTLSQILEIDESISKPIIDAYNTIMNPAIALPEITHIETFVIEINKLLVKDVIKNLLQTSQDILNSLYNT